jgi:hypothetical protein
MLAVWSAAFVEVILLVGIGCWLLAQPILFGGYYPILSGAPYRNDATRLVRWLHSSEPESALESGFRHGRLRAKEVKHYADVRKLFQRLKLSLLMTTLGAAAVMAIGRPSVAFLGQVQARALALLLLATAFGSLLAWWDWKTFFAWIHYPLFGESSWRLGRSAFSLALFPADFWRNTGLFLMSVPLIGVVALWLGLRRWTRLGAATNGIPNRTVEAASPSLQEADVVSRRSRG